MIVLVPLLVVGACPDGVDTTPDGVDTTPPVISNGQPTGTLAAGTTQTMMSVNTNEPATCKWGTSSSSSYADLANGFATTGGTTHTTELTGLEPGQTYTLYVRCQDGAGNANASSYTIRFSVASGEPEPGERGSITVDPHNPAWLRYHNGETFFMVGAGDPEGFLYRGTRLADGTRDGDQLELIGKLALTGANSIYLMAVRSHGGDGNSTHNPWIDNDPGRGLNHAVLDQWEEWFTLMDDHEIVIFFFYYDDSADPFGGSSMGAAERQFIADLTNRFKHHRNLIWCVAEEYSEKLSENRVSQIASEIRGSDPVHPIAVHQLTGTSFDFSDDPHVDQFAMQLKSSTIDELHSTVVEAWLNAAGRYNLNAAEVNLGGTPHGLNTERQIRQMHWAAVMGGAYVMVYEWDIANTPAPQLEQAGHIVRFMKNTRVMRMVPDDGRAFGQTEWVLVEEPSESFVAYSRFASDNLGLTDMQAGEYSLTWLDPVSGDEVQQTRSVASGSHMFALPSGFTGGEVALYIRKSNL